MFKIEQSCKNHQKQPGSFFLADQPWTKYCSQCALNMALCGKKIDKVLSQQQHDNKTQILSIVQQIKNSITRISSSNKIIDQIIVNIDTITKSQFAQIVTNFDNYVKSLCEMRDQILEIYQSNFPVVMQSYFQKQTKILLYQLEIIQNLEYIQGNYRSIIENRCQSQVNQKIQKWNTSLYNLHKLLPMERQTQHINSLLEQSKSLIFRKLQSIQPFKFQTQAQTQTQKQKISETKTTQQMQTHHQTVGDYSSKQNITKTKLKLRSKSKLQTDKRMERQSLKARKSIRDISNFQLMESFRI